MKQTSTEAKVAALKAQLGISSQPKEGDIKKEEKERLPTNQHEGEIEGSPWQVTRHWVENTRNLADS